MSIVTKPAIILAAAAAITLAPGAARAQEPKVRVTFGAGVTAGALDGDATLNLSAGYRFFRRFSFDVEVAGANDAADRFDIRPMYVGGVQMPTNVRIGDMMGGYRGGVNFPGVNFPNIGVNLPVPGNYRFDNDGRTILATVGFRYTLPSSEERFRPYVSGGLGMSRTEENFSMGIYPANQANGRLAAPTNLIDENRMHTGLAASGGVGASVRVFKQLSVGVDARYYRLDRGRNLGTFGGSVSYGF